MAKYPYSPVFYNGLQDASKLKEILIAGWLDDAGSPTFDIANAFAKALPEVDEAANTILNPKDSFEIIAAVCRAAEQGHGPPKPCKKVNSLTARSWFIQPESMQKRTKKVQRRRSFLSHWRLT